MKRLSALLFILLSIQICGCSDRGSKVEESVPPVAESQESETREPEEVPDDSDDLPVGPEKAAPQEEEPVTTTADDYYRVATNKSSADVESYAAIVKQQFLQQDWPAIAEEIAYPITISDTTYDSSAEFLDASRSFDSSLDEDFFAALEEEDCREMFCNWQGIMLGETGQIWINEVLDEEYTSQGFMITAINDLIKK